MIKIHALTHRYPGQRLALDNLALAIATGEFFVLTGPNGGGKSTLFRILCGLLRPSAGQVQVGGVDLLAAPAAARRLMGVVFQQPALDKHLTVLENLRIHAELHQLGAALFRQRLEESLTWSGLQERLGERVGRLSGGLARQVELVKALLHRPTLLLMDEPTTGLDPGARHAFSTTIQRLQRQHGMTVVMTSHIFSEAEEADSVAILQRGRLLARDTPATLRASLGRELLVVRGPALDPVADELTARGGLTVHRRPGELRVEGEEGMVDLLRHLLTHHRSRITAVTVQEPTLDDVYIHLTGNTLQQDEEETSP